jgi:hypothetical protein
VIEPDRQPFNREPRIALLPNGEVLFTLTQATALFGTSIAAFEAWPPSVVVDALLSPRVTSYSFGNGSAGPSAHVVFEDGSAAIAHQVWPELLLLAIPQSLGRSLFEAQLGETWLFGEADDLGHVFSRSLDTRLSIREESMPVCTARPLGSAVRFGDTIFTATADNRTDPFCDAGKSWPDWLTTARHELVGGAADPLEVTMAESWRSAEPFASLAMAPSAFGAWVVFQTDGSHSLVAPPVVAYRVGADARTIDGTSSIEVSPSGLGVGPIGVVAMGDAIAVAYTTPDPTGVADLVVQRVEADGTLGPKVTIPTDIEANLPRLDLVASPDAKKLVVGWGTNDARYALARIDCADLP